MALRLALLLGFVSTVAAAGNGEGFSHRLERWCLETLMWVAPARSPESYERALARFVTVADGKASLTDEGKAELRRRLAAVETLSAEAWKAADEPDRALPAVPDGFHHRHFSIHRLPNFLLFGADTLGPDLADDFASLMDDASRTRFLAYLEKLGSARDVRPMAANPAMVLDRFAAWRAGYPFAQTIYSWPKKAYLPPDRRKDMDGTVEVFFASEAMPPPIAGTFLGDLYPIPAPEAVRRVRLVWPGPIGLDPRP